MVACPCSHKVNGSAAADGWGIVLFSCRHAVYHARLSLPASKPFCIPCIYQCPPSKKTHTANLSKQLSTATGPSSIACSESTVDQDGYLSSSRAARELALSILYAALVLGEKPMRVFRDRLRQQSGYLTKDLLAAYKHSPDVGGPIVVDDTLSVKEIEDGQHDESLLEAAVLSAPPTKVYRRSILKMAQELIQVTADTWSEHDLLLSDLVPKSWQERGGHAAIQQCILHMSMAEITRHGTPPKVAIHEAVQLGQRFMDMRSARTINGCLRSFMDSAYYKDSHMK